MIARMRIRRDTWEALLGNGDLSPVFKKLNRTGALKEVYNAINEPGFVLIDIIATEAEIDELWSYFPQSVKRGGGPQSSPWKWNFDGTVNRLSEYYCQRNDLLAVQPAKDDWGHSWLGQGALQYESEDPIFNLRCPPEPEPVI